MTTQTAPQKYDLANTLNDCSIDAIIALDSDWKIIAWNTAAELYYDRPREQALDRFLFEVLPDMEKDVETVDAIHFAMRGFKSFVPASRKHSFRMHIENHFIPLKDENSGFMGVMNIAHDVAHRIKAERQLQQTNRQLERTLDEMASFTMQSSNNIKAPIRHIYTALEHLLKTEARDLSNASKASFRRIQSSLNRMDLLLDDLLRLARINIKTESYEAVDLGDVVEPVLASLERKISETDARIEIKDSCSIKGDKEQLQLLFFHLLDNALKFNQSRPQIVINAEEAAPATDNESLMEQRYKRITVSDNGIGIDPADTDKIFNIFEKLHSVTEYRGSGMGLAIARKVMDAHGGYFEVETEPGKGSSFHCYFPVN